MTTATLSSLQGHAGELARYEWPSENPRWRAVLVHGYGEHLGRYDHVAKALTEAGASVSGADHLGHGRSSGERVVITDFDAVVDDLRLVVQASAHPELPLVLIGHSMGGMLAARYAQRFAEDITALVLSGPVLGTWRALDLLEYDEIPDEPIDASTLSRDPAVGAAYLADPLVWHGPFDRRTLIALDDMLRTIDFDHPLGDELPALWIHGLEDELVPIEDTRTGMDRIRGLNFNEILYPGGRHEMFNETNSAQVLADVTGFVRGALG